jgi:hypothetical protein
VVARVVGVVAAVTVVDVGALEVVCAASGAHATASNAIMAMPTFTRPIAPNTQPRAGRFAASNRCAPIAPYALRRWPGCWRVSAM